MTTPILFRPNSMVAEIDNLDVNETWSKATRFNPDTDSRALLSQERERLRSTTEPAIRRVRERDPSKRFISEAIDARTSDWCIIVAIVITRVE